MGALDCVTPIGAKISPTESTEVFTVNMSSNSTLNESRRDLESHLSRSNSTSAQPCWSMTQHSLWHVANFAVLLIVVGVLCVLYKLEALPSHKSGFFCNDPTLSYTFTGDTVPIEALITSVIVLPLIFIFIVELLLLIDSGYLLVTRVKMAAITTCTLIRNYYYGFFINLVVVGVMKCVAGTPRPTFFDICEPDAARTCNGSEYVKTFECTSTKYSEWLQFDASHSFPSGHASLSFYCGFFLAWYLQRRVFDWRSRTVCVIPVLQMICASYAAYCSLTRITDHRHHWWDVLVGVVIGAISLIYVVYALCDNFPKNVSTVVSFEEHHQPRNTLSSDLRQIS